MSFGSDDTNGFLTGADERSVLLCCYEAIVLLREIQPPDIFPAYFQDILCAGEIGSFRRTGVFGAEELPVRVGRIGEDGALPVLHSEQCSSVCAGDDSVGSVGNDASHHVFFLVHPRIALVLSCSPSNSRLKYCSSRYP
mgnify:CR=1 FL=1